MTNKITIPFCFTSKEAKELYNNKPPQYATERASGFDLRAVKFECSKYIDTQGYKCGYDICNVSKEVVGFIKKGSLFLQKNAKILIKTGIRVALPVSRVPILHINNENIQLLGHSMSDNDPMGTFGLRGNRAARTGNQLTELQIRSLTEKEEKQGLVVASGIKTIDNDNTGELYFMLRNISSETQEIKLGDRIAQGVLNPLIQAEFQEYSQEEFEEKFCKSTS